MATDTDDRLNEGASPTLLALRAELAAGTLRNQTRLPLGDIDVDVCAGSDSLWAILRRAKQGGLALRLAYTPGGIVKVRRVRAQPGEALRLSVTSAIGVHLVMIKTDGLDLHRLQVRVDLTPAAPLLVPYLPRDLYPLDAQDDPMGAVGTVEAGQRGVNT